MALIVECHQKGCILLCVQTVFTYISKGQPLYHSKIIGALMLQH